MALYRVTGILTVPGHIDIEAKSFEDALEVIKSVRFSSWDLHRDDTQGYDLTGMEGYTLLTTPA